MSVLFIFTLAFVGLALVVFILALRSFRARKRLKGSIGVLAALILLAAAGLSGALSVATQGYRALTHEQVAAVVDVRPSSTKEHAFEATVELPDGSEQTYDVRGDQLYVDAKIVKWEPFMNVLGLHTAYELDRLGGRYRDIEMAQNAPRTIHSLGQERHIEIIKLIEQVPWLERLVDAEYGSATFVDVDRPRRLEVRVSTSGLLMRESKDASESQ